MSEETGMFPTSSNNLFSRHGIYLQSESRPQVRAQTFISHLLEDNNSISRSKRVLGPQSSHSSISIIFSICLTANSRVAFTIPPHYLLTYFAVPCELEQTEFFSRFSSSSLFLSQGDDFVDLMLDTTTPGLSEKTFVMDVSNILNKILKCHIMLEIFPNINESQLKSYI